MIKLVYAGETPDDAMLGHPAFESVAAFSKYGSGFIKAHGDTFCILPRPFVSKRSEGTRATLADVALLVRALRQYARVREKQRNVGEWRSDGIAVLCNEPNWAARIEAAVSLVDDFFVLGSWRRDASVCTPVPPGDIHWARTLRQSTPLLGERSVLYDPFLRRRRVHDPADPLWNVWADCVRESGEFLGLQSLGVKWPGNGTRVPHRVAQDLCRSEGGRVFDDRSRKLVGLLKAFLEIRGTERTKQNQKVSWLRIEHEEHLWEAVLRNALTGTDAADTTVGVPTMPAGRWFEQAGWRRESGLRIDCRVETVYQRDRWLIVADAKRYETDSAITGTDMYKQWLYAFFSSDAYTPNGFPHARIVNVFVMPSGEPGIARGTGLYVLTPESTLHPTFGTVMRFELDYRRALELFLAGRPWPDLANRIVSEWLRVSEDARTSSI